MTATDQNSLLYFEGTLTPYSVVMQKLQEASVPPWGIEAFFATAQFEGEWDESKHPREHGKFAPGGAGGDSGSAAGAKGGDKVAGAGVGGGAAVAGKGLADLIGGKLKGDPKPAVAVSNVDPNQTLSKIGSSLAAKAHGVAYAAAQGIRGLCSGAAFIAAAPLSLPHLFTSREGSNSQEAIIGRKNDQVEAKYGKVKGALLMGAAGLLCASLPIVGLAAGGTAAAIAGKTLLGGKLAGALAGSVAAYFGGTHGKAAVAGGIVGGAKLAGKGLKAGGSVVMKGLGLLLRGGCAAARYLGGKMAGKKKESATMSTFADSGEKLGMSSQEFFDAAHKIAQSMTEDLARAMIKCFKKGKPAGKTAKHSASARRKASRKTSRAQVTFLGQTISRRRAYRRLRQIGFSGNLLRRALDFLGKKVDPATAVR